MNYPSLDTLRRIHDEQIDRYGGEPGLRDPGALKSAHQQPLQRFGERELYPSLHEKAATLGHGIISNYPFVDGNKRTGTAAMILLLEMNDLHFNAETSELVDLIVKIARGNVPKEELTEWLSDHTSTKTDQ